MQHYLMTRKLSHQKSHSTQERIRVQHHLQGDFSFTGPFSQYTEPPMTAKSVQSFNMHAQRNLAGFNFVLLMDMVLVQAVFNLQLHKLVQTSSQSAVEFCGLRIKASCIIRSSNCRLQGRTWTILNNENSLIKIRNLARGYWCYHRTNY